MSYEYAYFASSDFAEIIISLLVNSLFSSGLAIATYILRSLAIYTIAKRRGLHNPWLAWIPVADLWLLGCISDQYQYVVKRQNKSRRKILLVLQIAVYVLAIVTIILSITSLVNLIQGISFGAAEEQLMMEFLGLFLGALGVSLPLAVLTIVLAVFRYIALYDLYASCAPQNATLFLVLGIVISVTEPFFLFFNRNKDEGMPPRRPEPNYYYHNQPPVYQPPQDPWNQGQ